MRKEGLPFPCGEAGCRESFNSKGAREMHRKAKHQTKVHSFEDLATVLKQREEATARRSRQQVPLALAVVALIASLASAGFYAALVRFGIEPAIVAMWGQTAALPWWAPMVCAQAFGLGTGLCILSLRPKTVAKIQQK